MSLRLALLLIAALGGLGVVGALYVQTERLASAERQLEETRAENAGLRTAITELAAERAAAERRKTIVQEGREAIVSAPEAEDAPISQVLRRGLQTADRIGGAE